MELTCVRPSFHTKLIFNVPEKDWIAKSEALCNQIRNQILFLEGISNPSAILQKGMQSGFCNPASQSC